jgi:hypothetical protein
VREELSHEIVFAGGGEERNSSGAEAPAFLDLMSELKLRPPKEKTPNGEVGFLSSRISFGMTWVV